VKCRSQEQTGLRQVRVGARSYTYLRGKAQCHDDPFTHWDPSPVTRRVPVRCFTFLFYTASPLGRRVGWSGRFRGVAAQSGAPTAPLARSKGRR